MGDIAAQEGVTSNRYTILGRLAGGGMADIFLARVLSEGGVQRHLVLKRVLAERSRDPQFARMFLDEVRLAAQLQHPNIAQLHDVGRLGGSYFYTMEYVHGADLRNVLATLARVGHQIPIHLAMLIASGALAALRHAHTRLGSDGKALGVVHRDVTPSNVMVSYEGGVKLLDFGVAKASQHTAESRSGTIKGKIAYLSPEQCQNGRVDARSDLFSLGIVMHEMLVLRRMYRRETDFATMMAIVNEPPPVPSSIRPDIPPEIDRVVLKALAKDPAQRYGSAGEMLEAIENIAAQERMVMSSMALGRFLCELVGERPEPWLEVANKPTEPTMITITGESVPQLVTSHTLEQVDLVAEDDLQAQLAAAPALGPPAPQSEDPSDPDAASQAGAIEATKQAPSEPAIRRPPTSTGTTQARPTPPGRTTPPPFAARPSGSEPGAVPAPIPRTPSGPIAAAVPAPVPRTSSGPIAAAAPAPIPRTSSGPLAATAPAPIPRTPSGPIAAPSPRAPSEPIASSSIPAPIPRVPSGPIASSSVPTPIPRVPSGPIPRAPAPRPIASPDPSAHAPSGPIAVPSPATSAGFAVASSPTPVPFDVPGSPTPTAFPAVPSLIIEASTSPTARDERALVTAAAHPLPFDGPDGGRGQRRMIAIVVGLVVIVIVVASIAKSGSKAAVEVAVEADAAVEQPATPDAARVELDAALPAVEPPPDAPAKTVDTRTAAQRLDAAFAARDWRTGLTLCREAKLAVGERPRCAVIACHAKDTAAAIAFYTAAARPSRREIERTCRDLGISVVPRRAKDPCEADPLTCRK